jgi:hypothetical protein
LFFEILLRTEKIYAAANIALFMWNLSRLASVAALLQAPAEVASQETAKPAAPEAQ